MGEVGSEYKWTKSTPDDIGIIKLEKSLSNYPPEAFCSVDSFGFVLR